MLGFNNLPTTPDWLERALKYLSMTDFELSLQETWEKSEVSDRLDNFKEMWTSIKADADIFENHKVRSLLISLK